MYLARDFDTQSIQKERPKQCQAPKGSAARGGDIWPYWGLGGFGAPLTANPASAAMSKGIMLGLGETNPFPAPKGDSETLKKIELVYFGSDRLTWIRQVGLGIDLRGSESIDRSLISSIHYPCSRRQMQDLRRWGPYASGGHIPPLLNLLREIEEQVEIAENAGSVVSMGRRQKHPAISNRSN